MHHRLRGCAAGLTSTVLPGLMRPSRSAASIIASALRRQKGAARGAGALGVGCLAERARPEPRGLLLLPLALRACAHRETLRSLPPPDWIEPHCDPRGTPLGAGAHAVFDRRARLHDLQLGGDAGVAAYARDAVEEHLAMASEDAEWSTRALGRRARAHTRRAPPDARPAPVRPPAQAPSLGKVRRMPTIGVSPTRSVGSW
jgi:hypothetical protein